VKRLSPVALVFSTFLFTACEKNAPPAPSAETAPESSQAKSASARYVAAQSAKNAAFFEAPARVLSTPEDSAVVSAPLALRVTRVRVQPGQDVKQGEPLLDVAMPELIRAVGAHNAAELRLKGYEARKTRLMPLVSEGLARAADAAELDAQIALARADLESAHAVLRTAGVPESQVSALVAQSGSMMLRAPIAGVVVGVAARLGAMWQPTDGALVELAAASSSLVEARFQVLPADTMHFVWSDADGAVPLTLKRASPRASAEDGSRVVWLTPVAPQSRLVPGSLGSVRIVPEADWQVVPERALLREGDAVSVFVEAPSGPQKTQVKLLRASSTEAVVSGLSAGARVLASAPSR
jgi:biotin carboxyl carrier protein